MTRIKSTVSLFSIWQRELNRVLVRFCYTIYTITIVTMHLVSHSPYACQLTSLSHVVTITCDYMWCDHSVTLVTLLWVCDCHMIFPMLHLSNNLKEKKRNINIDLAILPSHDIAGHQQWARGVEPEEQTSCCWPRHSNYSYLIWESWALRIYY